MVIAAVGDHFTYTSISRVKEVFDEEGRPYHGDDQDWEPDLNQSKFEALDWSPILVWGKPESEPVIEVMTTWTKYVDTMI